MNSGIYNTSFEFSLRILLLLSKSTRDSLNADEILAFDFIISYSKDFNLTDYSLHGDSNYKFSELSYRKSQINEAIKLLVRQGLVEVLTLNGFTYKISDKGLDFIISIDNAYTDGYIETAEKAFHKYEDFHTEQLLKEIKRVSFGGGLNNV